MDHPPAPLNAAAGLFLNTGRKSDARSDPGRYNEYWRRLRSLAAMTTIRISDPSLMPALLEHLTTRRDIVVAPVAEDAVRISILGSYSGEAMDLTADLLVRAWEAAQRAEGIDVTVEVE